MFPRAIDDARPLVVGDVVFGQRPEMLYMFKMQVLNNVGVWRLHEFAQDHNPGVVEGFPFFLP
jgi:hypothetical protein